MKVLFWHSEKKHEKFLAEAFIDGMKRHGDSGEARPASQFALVEGFDAHAMVGVKSAKMFHACRERNIPTIMLDKGYLRDRAAGVSEFWKEWRVSVNAQHSTDFVQRAGCDSRRSRGLTPRNWHSGDYIIIAGSSEKYHAFHGLPHPTEYARDLARQISRVSDRPILYRPKPSWRDAQAVKGTTFSRDGSLIQLLGQAHCLVTHGSNACVEAVMYGVPSIVLGPGIAAPISSCDIADIESPRRATEQERQQWLNNLTYCNWSLREFDDGRAWPTIRSQI